MGELMSFSDGGVTVWWRVRDPGDWSTVAWRRGEPEGSLPFVGLPGPHIVSMPCGRRVTLAPLVAGKGGRLGLACVRRENAGIRDRLCHSLQDAARNPEPLGD